MLSLFSILPDIDLYLPIPHRSYTHSILVVTFLMLFLYFCFTVLERFAVRSYQDWKLILMTISFFWLSHILFDTTFGPIGYFYPFDTRFYDLSAGVVINIENTFVSLSRLFFDPIILTPETGVSTFFVNWTREERISFFGSPEQKLSIQDFFMHAVLFGFYVVKVLIPAIISLYRSRYGYQPEPSAIKKVKLLTKKVEKFFKPSSFIITFILLILFSGLVTGPLSGSYYTESSVKDHQFYVLSDGHRVYNEITYKIPYRSASLISISFPQTSLNYSVIWGDYNTTVKDLTTNILNNQSQFYDNATISAVELAENYQNMISSVKPKDWIQANISSQGVSYQVVLPEQDRDGTYEKKFGFVLYQWESTDFFIRRISTQISIEINRSQQYQTGWTLTIGSFLSLVIILTYLGKFQKPALE